MKQILKDTPKGVYIEVFVKPRAKKTQVPTHCEGDIIFAKIKAPPVRGKANKELLHELRKLFNISQDRITIVSGHTSTKKVVFIEIEAKKVDKILAEFQNR